MSQQAATQIVQDAANRVQRWLDVHMNEGSATRRLACSYEGAPLDVADIRVLLAATLPLDD
jgi:hypothetical protein